jgi:hypothetical protein
MLNNTCESALRKELFHTRVQNTSLQIRQTWIRLLLLLRLGKTISGLFFKSASTLGTRNLIDTVLELYG